MTSSYGLQPVDEQEKKKELGNKLLPYVGGLTTEVGTGLALDRATEKLLLGGPKGWAAYGVINALGGAAANYVAQQQRTEEDLDWFDRDWGEVISSGVLGIIPYSSLRLGRTGTKLLGEAGTLRRATTGGIGVGVADRYLQSGINEGELPSATDVAIGGISGGIISPTIQKLGNEVASIYTKYANKSSAEINKSISKRERSALTYWQKELLAAKQRSYETGDNTEVNALVGQYRRAQWNFKKSQGEYKGFKTYEDFERHTHHLKLNLDRSMTDLPFLPSGKPRTNTEEYVRWLDDQMYDNQLVLAEDMQIPELIEPGKRLNRNKLASRFWGNDDFQRFMADYLNQAYLWRKSHDGSLDGFPLGRTVIDPDGEAWYFTKTGFKNVNKTQLWKDFRATARAINAQEVKDEFIRLLPGIDPAEAIRYADKYLEFNRSAKRQLVKWIERENKRAGKTVIDLDHITSIKEWEGTGADIFFNLQPLDKSINRAIGKKSKEEWKNLNLALGSVKNIKQDIVLWLDKFGPDGVKSGELWEFFRYMSSEDRKILWNAVIVKGIPVDEALEQMKFGEKLFQLDLFDPDPKPVGNAGIWNVFTRFKKEN